MPRAALILVFFAVILIALVVRDAMRGDAGNAITRKARLRVAGVFILVALMLAILSRT